MKKSIVKVSIFIFTFICCWNAEAQPTLGSPEDTFPTTTTTPTTLCPAAEHLISGICCPLSQNYIVSGACSTCNATGRIQISGAPLPDGCCPNGNVVDGGKCCPSSTPYNLSGVCNACNATGRSKVAGSTEADGCCLTGEVFEAGACRAPCAAATPARWSNGTCHVCPEATPVASDGHCCNSGETWASASNKCCVSVSASGQCCEGTTPYLYPTNNATYNNLGWGGTCRECPETQPWKYPTNPTYTAMGWSGHCRECPEYQPHFYAGACHNCPEGQSVINGSCNACNMITKVSLQFLGEDQQTNGTGISYNANATGNSCASNLVDAALAYADSIAARDDYYYDDKVVDYLQTAALANGCSEMGGHWNRCINGTWYLDANCNPISAASLPAGCSASQITAVVTTQFYDSSPISLIMDKNLNIDNDVTITSFAVNPNEFGKWYSWKASAKAPLLVYDPAHTGLVNSATQLFGNWTFGGRKLASLLPSFQADKVQWENGYQALATLDANGDQKISAEELSPLALWFDENRDGKSQAGEVKTVSEVGITALYFNPDRRDKVTSSIYATLGYERTVDGKTVTGSSVDWYATKANNPQALIADRLLRNINQSEKTDNLSEGKKDSNSASAKQKSAISGVWAWDFNLANAKNKNPQGVLMFGSVKGDSIKGMSFSSSELQNPVNDIAHIAKVYNLEGTLSQDQNGQEKIAFSSKFASAKINSQAVLSKDGSKLEGSSTVVSKDQNGKAETITYQWTAVRYTKK